MQALRIASGLSVVQPTQQYRSTLANHRCSSDTYSNSFSMQPRLNRHTIIQQGKFLKDIGHLGGENIMKIRLQYIQEYTIFFVLINDITWEAPRYPSEPPWRRKELCVDISVSKEGNKKTVPGNYSCCRKRKNRQKQQ